MISIGQTFKQGDDLFLLAQVGYHMVALISLSSGNRWAPPIKVANPGKISKGEWNEISDMIPMKRIHITKVDYQPVEELKR